MNPDAPAFLTLALAVASAGVVMLWRVQTYCPECAHCRQVKLDAVTEKKRKDEAEEEQRHRWFHKMYPVKWGSTDCFWCRKGLDGQEPPA